MVILALGRRMVDLTPYYTFVTYAAPMGEVKSRFSIRDCPFDIIAANRYCLEQSLLPVQWSSAAHRIDWFTTTNNRSRLSHR
jgi:hypothetical protein